MVDLDSILCLPFDPKAALSARTDLGINRNRVTLTVDPRRARVRRLAPWQS